MLKRILLKAVPIPKIQQFDNYLFVGPHPDDIEVSCGATVAKLVAMGKKVSFVVCTDGSVGSIDGTLSREQIVEIRKAEATKSANLLGVTDVTFLSFVDGDNYSVQDLTMQLTKILLQKAPQIVFCPDHTVPSECHPDHLKCGQATTNAVFCASWDKITSQMGLKGSVGNVTLSYYYTHKPNRYLKVRGYHKIHMQAIACHTSQFDEGALKSLDMYFKMRKLRFGWRACKGRADGYRVLCPTHQHCFPEISE